MPLEKVNPLYGAFVRFKSAARAFNRTSGQSQFLREAALEHYCDLLSRRTIISTPAINSSEGKFNQSKWALDGWIVDNFSSDDEDSFSNTSIALIKCDFALGDNVETGLKKDVDDQLKKAFNFIKLSCAEKAMSGDTEESNELRNLINSLHEKNELSDLKVIYVTDKELNDGRLQSKLDDKKIGLTADVVYYDLKEYDQLTKSENERLPLDINLESDEYSKYNLDVVSLENHSAGAPNNYVGVAPGDLIADLYDRYNSRILQSNVRLFLSARRKANKAMLNTIKNNPHGFLAYNNGLSITCSKVVRNKTGRITKLVDMQIVNGGQTTATLSKARKMSVSKESRDKISLKDVRIAIKITEIQKKNKSSQYEKMISNISEAANTQTAVQKSDFLSNKTLFVDCERHSKQLMTKIEGNHFFYFFERMAGQYNSTRDNGTPKQQKVFESKHPSALSFDKLDFATWHSSMYPKFSNEVAEGKQKRFLSYMGDKFLMDGKTIRWKGLSDNQFKWIAGYGLLFRRVRQLCGRKGAVHYKPLKGKGIELDTSVALATTIYAMGAIHSATEGRLDYWSFFDGEHNLALACIRGGSEFTGTEFDDDLKKVILHTYDLLQQKGGASTQESAKKKDTRDYVIGNFEYRIGDLKQLEKLMLPEEDVNKRLASSDTEVNRLYKYFELLREVFGNNAHTVRLLHYYLKNSTGNKFATGKTRSLVSKYNSIAKCEKLVNTVTIDELKYLTYVRDDFKNNGFEFSNDRASEILNWRNEGRWSPNFDIVMSAFEDILEEDFDDIVIELASDLGSTDVLDLCQQFSANHFFSVSEISRLCDLLDAD